jgi:uncharacterized repeat protein (TIGR04138 family)
MTDHPEEFRRTGFVSLWVGTFPSVEAGQDGGQTGHVSAPELCEQLLSCRGEESPAILRELSLLRSEDVGKIVFGLVNAGIVRRQESDSEADFQGLFALE